MHVPTELWLASLLLFRSHAAAYSTKEVAAIRDYFYVGGGYINDGAGGHIFHNQLYVEKLRTNHPQHPFPLVFIHGQAQIGTVSFAQFVCPALSGADGSEPW